MISYVLSWLDEGGITDVLLICPASHRKDISHYIRSDPSSTSSSLKIDIQTFDLQGSNHQHQQHPSEFNQAEGTLHVLSHFTSKIPQSTDVIIVPCDFVPPPTLSLGTLLNKYRVESETDGAILTGLWYENKPNAEKDSKKASDGMEDTFQDATEPSVMMYDEKTGTLLFVDPPDSVDRNEEEIEIRMATLWKYVLVPQ